jgi:hypothetical protein
MTDATPTVVTADEAEAGALEAPMLETTPEKTYTDADFAAFNDDMADQAIDAISASIKIRYLITEKNFIAKLSTNEIVKIPLIIKLKDLESVEQFSDDSVRQFKELLHVFTTDTEVDKIENAPYPEALAISRKYFDLFTKLAQASVGK